MTEKANFTEALRRCTLRGDGWTLAVVQTEEEKACLERKFNTFTVGGKMVYKTSWIGYKRINGAWTDINDQPVIAWAAETLRQPVHGESDLCVRMNFDNSQWRGKPCGQSRPFVCQCM